MKVVYNTHAAIFKRVPNTSLSKKQIICALSNHYDHNKNDQFKKLVGFANDDGSRKSTNSMLDAHFSEHDISNVLCECGQSMLMDKNSDDDASIKHYDFYS